VELLPREGIVSAKGNQVAGPSRGFLRRGPTYQDARVARSRSWLPVFFWSFGVLGIAVLILGSTGIGRIAGRASEHFLLFYSGVFVLLALTGTVVIGLVATDRIILSPERRVTAQAVHRAVATGALAFLVIHIVTEIIAGRSHPADAVIPFLDQGRTFYLGLGTVASDLMVMIAVTGIFRARLATNMSPLMWRFLHGTAYGAWLIAIVHGLLAGRPAKAFFGFSGFVAWSYGLCVAGVGVALIVRFVAKDRAAEHTIAQPIPDRPAPPWLAAAAAPMLGQAGFGATPLPVGPARPAQRALAAGQGAAAAPSRAALPAGSDQAAGSNGFGHDDTRAAYAYRDTGAGFGDDSRGGFGQDRTRVHFGQDDLRGGFGQDDTQRYVPGDPRGGFGQDDVRGGYAPGDSRGRYRPGDVRGGYVPDDPRGGYGPADARGG